MRIAHVMVSDAFAGTERYVAEVAAEQARRGAEVTVIGGAPLRSALESEGVALRPGGSVAEASRSLLGVRPDVLHAHLTYAETAAVLTRPRHRAPVLSTRHLAVPRGQSRAGRVLRPAIERSLAGEVAISGFVADALGMDRADVLYNGVRTRAARPARETQVILVVQRLEAEKRTSLAIEAFQLSGLAHEGWRLVIAGSGSQEAELRATAAAAEETAVELLGHVTDAGRLFGEADLLLATASAEPFGLAVVEAMSAGLPVVATASGGHLETLGGDYAFLFEPEDPHGAAAQLRRLASSRAERKRVGDALRARQQELFSLEVHVDQLQRRYERLLAERGRAA